jgi:hypothetical protein
MALGADYSWARPGGAALRAAGVEAVGRYLASDGRGITAAEYQDLTGHGVGVWLVREGGAAGMLGGAAQGVADAQVAVQQISAAGLPSNAVVFAAADWDVSTAQFGACDDYMRGFASVIGVARTGIYGGLHYLNHAHAGGLAVAFWQAGATSWNQGEAPQMPINFVQTTDTPPLPGTDYNIINDMTAVAGSNSVPINNHPKGVPDMLIFQYIGAGALSGSIVAVDPANGTYRYPTKWEVAAIQNDISAGRVIANPLADAAWNESIGQLKQIATNDK